jgi:hypothetical protein
MPTTTNTNTNNNDPIFFLKMISYIYSLNFNSGKASLIISTLKCNNTSIRANTPSITARPKTKLKINDSENFISITFL